MTVGVEFGSRTVDVQGSGKGSWSWLRVAGRSRIKLQCWDTAGQDSDHST